ncbi:MAG: efflux RND transporter periplasmic adaptor subunit [bacterium]|nr:efflux RND transporter periplasmic adaptor subunit [bacterium]MCP5066879.1 efflux RND transporter periplasmic adaptor subunit [bacterium]
MLGLANPRWVGCLALAALACSDAPQDINITARPVVVQEVELVTLEEQIEATGELLAKDSATLASEVAGRITELQIDEGDRVEEGDLLLSIDPQKRELELADARARLAEAVANLEEQQRELVRRQQLFDRKIASSQALDKAKTALSLARSRRQAAGARVGVAARAVEDSQVRAPFSGLIASREVSRGEYVRVGQELFDLVALDPIEVEFSVAERDSARVRLGMKVAVRVSPYPEEIFTGEVSVISPRIDRRTRTLRVKARISNGDGRLRPGLFARADLGVATREKALVVPQQAVLLRAEGQIVYTVDAENRVHRVAVEAGIHLGGQIEIISGLGVGDVIVVRGHAALSDDMLVSRRNPDGSEERSEMNVAADAPDMAAGSAAPSKALR